MTVPLCTVCSHPRGDHRYNGARFNGNPQNLDCRQCDCELYVEHIHDWRQAPNGEMVCRVCRTVADDQEADRAA